MVARIRRPLFGISALLLTAGVAGAQGYTVRSWGYYDPAPYGPVAGETYSYSPYRPTVTLRDPWGRAYDMPLRPKVLYYDTPFLTQRGWYRPTSIAVMPNSRPPAYTVPARPAEPAQPAAPPAPLPTFRYDGGPANPVPDVAVDPPAAKPVPPRVIPDPPAAKPPPPTIPVPRPPGTATVPDRPAAGPTVPHLPSVPKVPALPDVPRGPGSDAGPAVPKLGPTPMDVPPAPRPGG